MAGAHEITLGSRRSGEGVNDVRGWMLGALVAALAAQASAAGAQERLDLLCSGTDAALTATPPTSWSGRYYAGQMAFAETRVGAQLSVTLEDGKVRVKPPKSSVPIFAKDAKDGWYELSDVAVDRLSIKGRVRFNRVERARLDIDRRTGVATFGAFQGVCQPVSSNPDATKF